MQPILSPAEYPEWLHNPVMLLNYLGEVGATHAAFHYRHSKAEIYSTVTLLPSDYYRNDELRGRISQQARGLGNRQDD